MPTSLVQLENITITVWEGDGRKVVLNRANLEIPELSVTALVGGSGSGKTTTGLVILRLLPLALKLQSGKVLFNGENLLEASGVRLRQIRGGEIGMVFQEPLDAFNPVFSIGYQIDEVLQVHTDLNRIQRQKRILELLDLVGLPDPKRMARDYPHQLSGGMRQRAMIAQAIAGNPKLIIADEPTSNLDVTLQAHIIELFKKLKDELKLSILLITHDLGMVAHMADHVVVMTQGKIVERGTAKDVLSSPKHSYTQELMDALL
ncbi:MAG: ABC transporter ATP-binding protein [Candidatus Omnitrophica bacterium]|nr:ABC transporter ATP-binding protein [Candidatus Omnitrophota bacterium]